ncbi:hypothetical protein [Chryseobacterium sp. 3008163]|uniref:hypothetical protein n=1 Tax=Chryseobacterium sp. 3008163 TaxID=2478663 RepID=UPI000F0CDF07|nr:hypothetical protein [Chryseobacterium sp. 3008163]AYN02339.1 hypothetical protein EAG08_20335 [Chryseobacterium sp. 3008163]
MYLKKNGSSIKYAFGMRFLLCCIFYNAHNTNAQVFVGKNTSLNIKDSIPFNMQNENSTALLYIAEEATVYNVEELSNVKVVIPSSQVLQIPSKTSLAKTVEKTEKRKTRKLVSKRDDKVEIRISKDENHSIISSGYAGKIAVITTSTYKAKEVIFWEEYRMLPVLLKIIFDENYTKSELIERIILSGKHTRPPPFFNDGIFT